MRKALVGKRKLSLKVVIIRLASCFINSMVSYPLNDMQCTAMITGDGPTLSCNSIREIGHCNLNHGVKQALRQSVTLPR